MARDTRTALLVLCGLLIVIAGLFQLLAFFPLSGLGLTTTISLAIIVPGAILMGLGLARAKPIWPVLLLALCSALLIVVSAGLMAFLIPGYYARLEERKLTIADVQGPIEEICLSASTDMGAMSISTTENKTLLVLVRFRMTVEEEPTFTYELKGTRLVVMASSRLSSMEIWVASWLNWSAHISTRLGAVEAKVNATNLVSLLLETSLGAISLSVDAITITNNCTISANTIVGSVEADVRIGAPTAPPLGCEIEARTSLGSIDHEMEGFEVILKDRGHLLVRSKGFESATRVLRIELFTSLGSVDVVARRM